MSLCVKCRRRLKPDATTCICGWSVKPKHDWSVRPMCALEPCSMPATVRVRGDGNAWVMLCVDHYPRWFTPARIAAKHPTDNPICNEIRAAYRDRKGGMPQEETLAAHVEREPGMDDEVFA